MKYAVFYTEYVEFDSGTSHIRHIGSSELNQLLKFENMVLRHSAYKNEIHFASYFVTFFPQISKFALLSFYDIHI